MPFPILIGLLVGLFLFGVILTWANWDERRSADFLRILGLCIIFVSVGGLLGASLS